MASKNSLLQKQNNVKSGRMDAEGVQAPDGWCEVQDENGYCIFKFEGNGYTYEEEKSWAGTGAHVYKHVENMDACNAICLVDSECKGFIFHNQADSDGNHKCYVVTSEGQG